MLKQSFSRITKVLTVLLAVLFVATMTVGAASACNYERGYEHGADCDHGNYGCDGDHENHGCDGNHGYNQGCDGDHKNHSCNGNHKNHGFNENHKNHGCDDDNGYDNNED